MKDKSNDSGSPACAVEPPRFTDFGLLTEAFNQGSLLNFAYRLAKGLTIDAKRIAAIKARNTNWREHKTFCGYCDDFENGAIAGKRGRPRQERFPVRYMIATLEYRVYLKLLKRWRRQGKRASNLAKFYPRLDCAGLPDCHAAAEIVCAKWRLPHSATRFLSKMSEENRPRGFYEKAIR